MWIFKSDFKIWLSGSVIFLSFCLFAVLPFCLFVFLSIRPSVRSLILLLSVCQFYFFVTFSLNFQHAFSESFWRFKVIIFGEIFKVCLGFIEKVPGINFSPFQQYLNVYFLHYLLIFIAYMQFLHFLPKLRGWDQCQ